MQHAQHLQNSITDKPEAAMLSNPLRRISPYHHVPADTMYAHGFDIQLQNHGGLQARHRNSPYGPAARTEGGSGASIRRRISRACDQCNQLRTKCNGQNPCAHCIELGLGCEYVRERKKRGKASRKDLARKAAAQGFASTTSQTKSDSDQDSGDAPKHQYDGNKRSSGKPAMVTYGEQGRDGPISGLIGFAFQCTQTTGSMESLDGIGRMQARLDHSRAQAQQQQQQQQSVGSSGANLDLNGYGAIHTAPYGECRTADMMGSVKPVHIPYTPPLTDISNYPDFPFTLQTLNAYAMASDSASPPWMAMPSPPPPPPPQQLPQQQQQQQLYQPALALLSPSGVPTPHATTPSITKSYNLTGLRYPVLEPLIPHLGGIISLSLACDLIDLYFSSSSAVQMHPMSPYVLGFVFRKRSLLHPTRPRPCQPALLASILWVAAQTSDAPSLTRLPSARRNTCQKLLDLTIGLLKPLVHTPSSAAGLSSPSDGSITASASSLDLTGAVGGNLEIPLAGTSLGIEDGLGGLSDTCEHTVGGGATFAAAGTLDDVITYIHLATVVSASEYKGASLRWWNSAWSLARELKLGRELPPNPPSQMADQVSQQYYRGSQTLDGISLDVEGEDEDGLTMDGLPSVSKEEREERRRIWWLVYIVDRHLALCYNRPLFLLDVECDNLLQPMDETAWQNGDFGTGTSSSDSSDSGDIQPRGPTFTCRGHNIYGFFLPLMAILGEIVDLHHLRNHPRFGAALRSSHEWTDQVAQITHHLGIYEQSLKAFEQKHLSPAVLAAVSREEQLKQHQAGAEALEKNESENENNNENENENVPTLCASNIKTISSRHVTSNFSSSSSSSSSPSSFPSPRMTELDIQTCIVTAYGTHVMHVLHVLLIGKWDPISLLDDDDLWISSPSFITATGHAVAAAEAISRILEYDPGLEFMPFYFGIYLLQGSFLLLLIADKLQLEASAGVTRACETIVRAHEACVVTLNTEYQRNFSRVMRSALAQVRGRVPPSGGRDDGDHGDGVIGGCGGGGGSDGDHHHRSMIDGVGQPQRRRRELLGLYRWTGDGTGLAL